MQAVKPILDHDFAHIEGLSRVTYTRDGSTLFTGAGDGFIRAFASKGKGVDGVDETSVNDELGNAEVLSLDCSDSHLCVASDTGEVQLLPLIKPYKITDMITRTDLAARSARFNPDGLRLAVTSDNLVVKVIDVEDPLQIILLSGHSKGVRQVTWSPDGQLLTTSGADGTIRIWDVSGSAEANCVKVIDGLIAIAEPEDEHSCEALWHPDGDYFVVATKTQEIAIIDGETWSKMGTFSEQGHKKAISALAWSPNGNYLASAGDDLELIIWSTTTKSPVTRLTLSAVICSMAFQPGGLALSYSDLQGSVTQWQNPIPVDLPGPSDLPKKAIRAGSNVSEDLGYGTDDRDDEAADGRGQAEPEWVDDDDNGGYVQPKAISAPSYGSSAVKAQKPFQPGSTPMVDERRYLAFNMLGSIELVERNEFNIVTIKFHDRERTGSHFNDLNRFSMGAMGELGSIFACAASTDALSLIYYKPYDSWASVQDWQYSLPAGESASLIAIGGISEPTNSSSLSIAGTGTIVVATNKGFLRFFTGSGIQKYVMNLGEVVLTMSAGKDWVLVIYGSGENMNYQLLDTDSFEIIQIGRIPIFGKAELLWCGFSDDDIPCIYDSNQILSLLDRSRRPRQARWVPALDASTLQKSKQQSFWAVGVTEEKFHMIVLVGKKKHPSFPDPVMQEEDLKFPLLRLEVTQGILEESYLRENTFLSHKRDGAAATNYALQGEIAKQEVEIDKYLLKIIQTACKAEKLSAALDAALLLTQPASLAAARKIAEFFRLPSLESRLEMIAIAKGEEQEVEKRGGKWGHLVDERTILRPESFDEVLASQARTRRTLALYGAPPASNTGSTRASTAVSRNNQDQDMDYSSAGEELEEGDESITFAAGVREGSERVREQSERAISSGFEGSDPAPMISSPVVPKKGTNPFAKKANVTVKPTPSASINPFSSRTVPAQGLKSSGSFFGRVHGVPETVAKANGKGSKQTNVFGSSKVGPKKRKSDVALEEDGEESRGTKGKGKKVVEKEKGLVKLSFGKAIVKQPVLHEAEEEDEDVEETQLESTQVETQESQPRTQEGTSSGFSKLAAFAAMAKRGVSNEKELVSPEIEESTESIVEERISDKMEVEVDNEVAVETVVEQESVQELVAEV